MKAYFYLALVIGASLFLAGLYGKGRADGKAACVAAQAIANEAAEEKAKADTRADIARSLKTGRQQEANRAAIEAHFQRLQTEADHDPTDPVDGCVLPAERLRRWAKANAGASDPGAAPGEPDGAASAASSAGFGGDQGPGSQPPPGGPGLPPAREPDVPPAGVPASGP